MYSRSIVSRIKNLVGEDHFHVSVKKCRGEINAYLETGIMPSSRYFEEVAFISRKEKKYKNEIAICEMYLDLIHDYIEENQLSETDIREHIEPVCVPIKKRIHNARVLNRQSCDHYLVEPKKYRSA